MDRKIKVYLDTSVISYLDQQDAPEKMKQTQELWEIFKTGKYEIVISNVALNEIQKCKEDKIDILSNYIKDINYTEYNWDSETVKFAKMIIEEGILRPKSFDDSMHIASAILSDSDIILSWNFKHLVNINTINGIRRICLSRTLNKIIDIYSPNILLEREDD